MPYEDRRKKGMDLGVVPPPLRPNCSFERALLFFQSSLPLRTIFFLFSEGTTDQSERGQVTRYDFDARCESTGGNPVCFGVVTVNREQHRKGFPSNDLFSDYTIPRNRFEGIHIRYLCEQTRPKRIHYREDGILWLIVRLVNPV